MEMRRDSRGLCRFVGAISGPPFSAQRGAAEPPTAIGMLGLSERPRLIAEKPLAEELEESKKGKMSAVSAAAVEWGVVGLFLCAGTFCGVEIARMISQRSAKSVRGQFYALSLIHFGGMSVVPTVCSSAPLKSTVRLP